VSLRLRAIGFPEVGDQEGIKRTLWEVARAGERTGDSVRATPFYGCDVLLDVDGDLRARSLAVALDGQRQPMLVERADTAAGRPFVDGFTCLDGHPITPIRCHPQGRFPELEPKAVYAVEYAGFCDQIEPGSGDYGSRLEGDTLIVEGVVFRCSRRRNKLTGADVSVCTLWIPGALIPVCCSIQGVPEPGKDARARLELYVTVHQRL
jgi:hypothetical protein